MGKSIWRFIGGRGLDTSHQHQPTVPSERQIENRGRNAPMLVQSSARPINSRGAGDVMTSELAEGRPLAEKARLKRSLKCGRERRDSGRRASDRGFVRSGV